MIKWLIKHLKKSPKVVTRYRITFCDEPDLSTAFGHDAILFWTREEAEAYLRRAWRNAITEEVNGAYRIDDAYLMVDKIDNVAGEE